MAFQGYRHRTDKTVGANVTTQKLAPGHPPEKQPKAGAENKTPAPVRAPTTTPDMARSTSFGRSSGDNGDNSGKQGYGGPSSLNPGERAGPATVNPQAPTDRVLSALIEGGTAALDKGDDWQTRSLDDPHDNPHKASPAHPFMKPANQGGAPSGKVPPKTGYVESAPVRKPQ